MLRFIYISQLACLLAGITLLATTVLAQETITIAQNGVVEMGSPGPWVERNGHVEIRSDASGEKGLFASRDLGTGDFQITAQLSISELNASGAAFQLGSSYFGFDGPNQQLYLSGALVGRHHVALGAARAHFEPEEWFTFEITRTDGTIRFLINDQLVHSVGSFAGIGQFGFTFSPLGRVASETNSILHVQEFVITGAPSPPVERPTPADSVSRWLTLLKKPTGKCWWTVSLTSTLVIQPPYCWMTSKQSSLSIQRDTGAVRL